MLILSNTHNTQHQRGRCSRGFVFSANIFLAILDYFPNVYIISNKKNAMSRYG